MERTNAGATGEIRLLLDDELLKVVGGATNQGSHGVPTHTPGRLEPDASERGTIAGAGL
jgi:hypothetical protein